MTQEEIKEEEVKEGITVDKFYEFILSKMSAEQALKLLLVGSTLSYEKLKFDGEKKVHPIIIIALAAMDLKWDIALEEDVENIRGLTVGTEEYINDCLL